MLNPIIFLLFSFAFGIVGQLSLKHGMNRCGEISWLKANPIKTLIKMFWNVYVIAGTFLFGVSMIFWIFALDKLDLSYAYPMVSINYVLITFISKLIFKEKVTKGRWVGVFVICLGVILISIT